MSNVLGRYELLHRLGLGGMAEVFLARARGAGDFTRFVVVKRMLPQLASDPHSVEMFLDEARLGSRLHHPNIVPVLDLGRIDGEYFMVLEFVDGADLGTLALRMKALGLGMPQALTAWIIARAADGLHAAHEARDPETGAPLKIVHRDVSTSNILLSRSGDVKVADFGVAHSSKQESHTTSGALKGKIAYMSPEQLLGLPLDARSDIFSLGTVLWQLVTRRRRHESRNELHIMQTTLQEPALPPSFVNPETDPAIEVIVMRMLERDRDARFQTMREVARELDRFAHTHGSMGHGELEAWLGEHACDLRAPRRPGNARGVREPGPQSAERASAGRAPRPHGRGARARRDLLEDRKTPARAVCAPGGVDAQRSPGRVARAAADPLELGEVRPQAGDAEPREPVSDHQRAGDGRDDARPHAAHPQHLGDGHLGPGRW